MTEQSFAQEVKRLQRPAKVLAIGWVRCNSCGLVIRQGPLCPVCRSESGLEAEVD